MKEHKPPNLLANQQRPKPKLNTRNPRQQPGKQRMHSHYCGALDTEIIIAARETKAPNRRNPGNKPAEDWWHN